jgi:hypothetical protein
MGGIGGKEAVQQEFAELRPLVNKTEEYQVRRLKTVSLSLVPHLVTINQLANQNLKKAHVCVEPKNTAIQLKYWKQNKSQKH